MFTDSILNINQRNRFSLTTYNCVLMIQFCIFGFRFDLSMTGTDGPKSLNYKGWHLVQSLLLGRHDKNRTIEHNRE